MEAGGSSLTGIKDAMVTRDIKNTVPIHECLISSHGVFVKIAPNNMAIHTPNAGRSNNILVAMAPTRIKTTITSLMYSILTPCCASETIGWNLCCCIEPTIPKIKKAAIDAIKASKWKHTFLSVTKEWRVAQVRTAWNPDWHIILRGWSNWTNYDEKSIEETSLKLDKAWIKTGIIVDFSHANSSKNHRNQPIVGEDVAKQLEAWNRKIVWVMIESNLNEWNQSLSDNLLPWVSITDACVNWETNDDMLNRLNIATWNRI